jgi:hypothetical protein
MSLSMPSASLWRDRPRAAISLFSFLSSDTKQLLPPCLQTALTRLVRLGHIDHCGATALTPNGALGYGSLQAGLQNTTVQFTEAVGLSTSRMAVLDDLAALTVLAHPPALAHWVEDLLCYLERARATQVLSEGAHATLQRFVQLPDPQRRILAALLLAAVLCPSSCDEATALPLWVFHGEHTSLPGVDNPKGGSSEAAAARPPVPMPSAAAAAVCRAAVCESARVDGFVDFNAAWESLCAAGLVTRSVPQAAADDAAVGAPAGAGMRGTEGSAAAAVAAAEPFFVRPDGSFSPPGTGEAPGRCCLPSAEGKLSNKHLHSSSHAPAYTATQMELDVITVLGVTEGNECGAEPQENRLSAAGGGQRGAAQEACKSAVEASEHIMATKGGAVVGHAAFDGLAVAAWPHSASRHAPMRVSERADTVTPLAAGDGAAAAAGAPRWPLHSVQTAATVLAAVAQQASAATASTAPKAKRARTTACEHAAAVPPPPFCLGSAGGAVDPAVSLAPLRAGFASASAPALPHATVAPAAARSVLHSHSLVATGGVPTSPLSPAVCSHHQCNPAASSLAASPPRIAAFFCIGRVISAGYRISKALRAAVADAASLALSLSTTEYGLAHDFNLLFMRQMVLARTGLGRFALAGSPFAREIAKLTTLQRGATGAPAGDVAAVYHARAAEPPVLMRPWVYFPSSLAFAQYNAARAWQRRVLGLTDRSSMLQRLLVAMRGNADGQEALAGHESVDLSAEMAGHAWISLLHRVVRLRLHLPSFTPAQAAAEDAATADGSFVSALRWRQPSEPAATSGSPASAAFGSAATTDPGRRQAAGPEEAPAALLAVQRHALNSATHAGPATTGGAAAGPQASEAAPEGIISYFSPFGARPRPIPPLAEPRGCSASAQLCPHVGDASAVCPSPDAFCRESVQARCSPAPAVLKSCLYVVSGRPS